MLHSGKQQLWRDKKDLNGFHTITLISRVDAPKMVVNREILGSYQIPHGALPEKKCYLFQSDITSLTLTNCANCSSVAHRSSAAEQPGPSDK